MLRGWSDELAGRRERDRDRARLESKVHHYTQSRPRGPRPSPTSRAPPETRQMPCNEMLHGDIQDRPAPPVLTDAYVAPLAELRNMSPELMFWFALASKMAITALFVSIATIMAERLGAAVGALVATLPVSAGPVYVFLALDHDASFISASAVVSLALNAATAIFVTVYVLVAQR